MTHVDPSQLVVGAPVVTSDATVTVDASVTNPVDPGDHVFQLIVVDENGVESTPVEQRVTISPDDRKPQAVLTDQPSETTEPRLRVENILFPGRNRFRLIVVDDDGIESDPVDTLVTIVAPVGRSDVVARAREARGRVFYATGVLLNAQHLDADQLDNHRGLARALAYLHGSGTLAGLEVT